MEMKKIRLWSKDYKMYQNLLEKSLPPEEQFPVWLLTLLTLRKGLDKHKVIFVPDFVTKKTRL